MRTCPTCGASNDEYAIVCSNCKGYLQNRIPNLDLFETAWGILHAPAKTFRRIALAEHKNYVIALFCLFGIAVSFSAFWYFKIGEHFDTLINVIIVATLSGVPLGLALLPVLTAIYWGVTRMFGVPASFRNSYSVLAYAFVPIILTLPIVLPIELLTFGMYLFTSNPSPYVIKPASFVILAGFDGLMSLWAIVLVMVGSVKVHRASVLRTAGIVGSFLIILALAFYFATKSIPSVLTA